jgi:hypothetical protein
MTSLHYEVPAVHPAVTATARPSAARVMYQLGQAIFTQGEPSNTIIRVEKGLIRLSVLSPVLKERGSPSSTPATTSVKRVSRESGDDNGRQSRSPHARSL